MKLMTCKIDTRSLNINVVLSCKMTLKLLYKMLYEYLKLRLSQPSDILRCPESYYCHALPQRTIKDK